MKNGQGLAKIAAAAGRLLRVVLVIGVTMGTSSAALARPRNEGRVTFDHVMSDSCIEDCGKDFDTEMQQCILDLQEAHFLDEDDQWTDQYIFDWCHDSVGRDLSQCVADCTRSFIW